MSLDFNTPEGQMGEQNESVKDLGFSRPKTSQMYILGLLAVCFILSLGSLILSLFSIQNIPKPAPVLIECDPNLLQKIERQAKILEEIAKTSKVQK